MRHFPGGYRRQNINPGRKAKRDFAERELRPSLKKANKGAACRFGVLPSVKARLCFDLSYTDARYLFPGNTPGELKVVCHGKRLLKSEISRAELASLPCYRTQRVYLGTLLLSGEKPADYPVPCGILADEFGQNARKDWPGKTHGESDLKTVFKTAAFWEPTDNWNSRGAWKNRKLKEGTGFFSTCKKGEKWFLADPEGKAFFSLGVNCVSHETDCRIDSMEHALAWLPERNDEKYGGLFREGKTMGPGDSRKESLSFSYTGANLKRVFGEAYREKWAEYIRTSLWNSGFNTIGNWSDPEALARMKMPYVASLAEFPQTRDFIFRDFPDVFSPEYRESAARCAAGLEEKKNDPDMIGYFLRNEPAWAFVDSIVLADEVLMSSRSTFCREELIRRLKEKYLTPQALSAAWNHPFSGFEDLRKPICRASSFSDAALKDQEEFSAEMVRTYVEIPSRACRAADPNHLNLGMRWAWIKNPDLTAGWENFDVFSINCYSTDPTAALDNVRNLGVDLPVMIGEFHFGALDAGPTATGLEAVMTQTDRAAAFRYYCERAAAHNAGVGCHYFQLYDQFVLGRTDGENYNIGLFDICSKPYPEMLAASRACAVSMEKIAFGEQEPTQEKANGIPMIAY